MGKITVLRLGHRIVRDQRISTHVALTARALGADEVVFSGEFDNKLIESIIKVVDKWGGNFNISYVKDWKDYINKRRGERAYIIHLTMYGANLPDVIEELREHLRREDLVLVVGSSKVPLEMYEIADINVAVSNQPHSEVAALAVTLDWLYAGNELTLSFPNAKVRITPSRFGKARSKVKLAPDK